MVRISPVEEHLAWFSMPLAAEGPEARDLGIVEFREHRGKLFVGFHYRSPFSRANWSASMAAPRAPAVSPLGMT